MDMAESIVHVVDDDDSFRTAVVRLLKATGYRVKAYASAGEVLLEKSAAYPGCFVLDMVMPGLSGIDLQTAFINQPNPPQIIFLSAYADIPTTVQAMKLGAIDVLSKPVDNHQLMAAVDRALRADQDFRSARHELQTIFDRFNALTPRDREVLALVTRGHLNREIAVKLNIAERTVKAHRAHMMEIMQANTLPDLVRMAERIQPTSQSGHSSHAAALNTQSA
ncbi:MAG TPA: response regulator [Spongiibacteraceae bacterium]|nr:response regulator [Spongiibacteraceae bacterium]